MKIQNFKLDLPQSVQLLKPQAAQALKGGSANSNAAADADPVVIDVVGGS